MKGPTRVIISVAATPSWPTILPSNVLTSPCAVISCWSVYQRPSNCFIAGKPFVFDRVSRFGSRPVNSPETIDSANCALVSPATCRTMPNNSPNTPSRSLSSPSNSASLSSFSLNIFSSRSLRASSRAIAAFVLFSRPCCLSRLARNSFSRRRFSALSFTRPSFTRSKSCCSVSPSSTTGFSACPCACSCADTFIGAATTNMPTMANRPMANPIGRPTECLIPIECLIECIVDRIKL